MGGLAAAIRLAGRGVEVLVVDQAGTPGGKMRRVHVAGAPIDAGPTVLTMRDVFDDLFAGAGASLDAAVTLRRADVLARHAWSPAERLDLYGEVDRSADAIGALSGADEARRFRRFSAHAERTFRTLEHSFMRSPDPGLRTLVRSAGWTGAADLWSIRPFTTLARELEGAFADPRLRQLFGRYATYCGSSPYLSPATLMLIAHVERSGVWMVEGGMHRVAQALADLAARLGARFRYGTAVASIDIANGRAAGITLESGERLEADAIISNADAAALARGRFGADAQRAVGRTGDARRSLSALVWTLVGDAGGWPLLRHNVFFSRDYAAEFDDLFRVRRVPRAPTVYVCAQDRGDQDAVPPGASERLLCLINAPPIGDVHPFDAHEVKSCEERAFDQLQRCGLAVRPQPGHSQVTTPADFELLFPATGGGLYGIASHGWRASFQRPRSRSRIPGLYLAGGSVHPGPGVPMAALSGSFAAAAVMADFASTSRSRPTAMHGGMSTP